MTHDAYSTKRVTVWSQERDGKAGYAIKYQDGYMSWCPEDVYDRDYQSIEAMSFGHAVHALKHGQRVARSGWNGKDMWLAIVLDWSEAISSVHTFGKPTLPFIVMKTADGSLVPWLASQTDVLANDWRIVT
jgi:hypothetical protein